MKFYDVASSAFVDSFGFAEQEVAVLLEQFGMPEKYEEVQTWYGGYHFGKAAAIYNPLSVLHYVDVHLDDMNKHPERYFEKITDNNTAYEILQQNSEQILYDIDSLLEGKCINRYIDRQLTHADIEGKTGSTFWSIMFASGHLTTASEAQLERSGLKRVDRMTPLVIPNREVHDMWENRILALRQERGGRAGRGQGKGTSRPA